MCRSCSHFLVFLFNSILAFAGNSDEIEVDSYHIYQFPDENLAMFNAKPRTTFLVLGFSSVYAFLNVVIIVMVLLNIVVYKFMLHQEENPSENLDDWSSLLMGKLCRRFSAVEILSATNDFDYSLIAGRGGYGTVYKGVIDNGRSTVAIKRLVVVPDGTAELEILPGIKHCNIISLVGYCDSLDERILVFQYMVNGTIADCCHRLGRYNSKYFAPWVSRLKMCIAVARALNYLHTGVSVDHMVIHRDVKSSNIMLDENWIAKIIDFGSSIRAPKDTYVSSCVTENHEFMDGVSTLIQGTPGYLDPHYFHTGKLTSKVDVFAFGVVLFEVLSGRAALAIGLDEKQKHLATWAKHCCKEGTIDLIIDPNLRGEIAPNCLSMFVQIASRCLHNFPKKRPTMAEVVVQLQLALAFQERGGSSIPEEEVCVTSQTYCRGEPSECSRTWEVINADNADHHEKKIDGFMNKFEATNNTMTFVKPGRRIKATQKARAFFSVTARSISGIFQRGEQTVTRLTTSLRKFKLADLKKATLNFSPDMKLGKEYFQRVFIGWFNERKYTPSKVGVGMAVAIKKFNGNSPLIFESWKTEVQLFGKFNHPNLVKLLGYCWEDKELFIVYEYLQNGSLDKLLFNEGENPLSWDTRLNISIGAARGLCFLHNTENGIIHRKIKTSNILLDGDLNAKLADFGLAKLGSAEEHTGLTASIAGAFGYLAPEYIATGCWYSKSDVYGFGVVMLELLTGQRVKNEFWYNDNDDDDDLVEWARVFLQDKTELKKLIDPRLQNKYPLEEALQLASLILKCLETFPSDRPSIEQVLESLEQINGVNVKHKEKCEEERMCADPEAIITTVDMQDCKTSHTS